MGPPPLKKILFGPPGPRDPLQRLGRIGGNRSPLCPSKSVVIEPILSPQTVWPTSALVYPDYNQNLMRKPPLLRPGCLAFSVSTDVASCGVPRGRNTLLPLGSLVSFRTVCLSPRGSVIGPISGGYFDFRPPPSVSGFLLVVHLR